jgi:hypothetical protein
MNVYDEFHLIRGYHGAGYNKRSTLSTALQVTLTTAGWYKISANVDYCWSGPASTVTTASSTLATHQWARETVVVRSDKPSQKIALVRSGTVSGVYHICMLKGF